MATALGIITRAMRLAGVIGKGETPDADESADGLVALNSMLDSWQIESLFVSQILEESFTLTSGFDAFTIGSGGNFNTTRPAKVVDTCFILLSNIIYNVKVVDEKTFTGFQTVGQTGMPHNLYYDAAYPLATIFFDYTTDQAYNFHLKSWRALQSFSTLTTALSMPPGNERAITYSLAQEFGPEFGAAIPDYVNKIAGEARANIKRINLKVPILGMEVGYINNRRIWNIRTGDL